MHLNNENLVIEHADIRFRNFEGKEGKFNPPGRRNFCVLIDKDISKELEKEGWNIKYLNPIDPSDEQQAYLQVSVSFDNYPPNIYLISSKGRNRLDENDVKMLDFADIVNTDVVIRPYKWNVNGKSGVKAYVKSMYVTIEEDEFESKYFDTPDSAENTIGGCGNCDACDGSCHHED